MNIDNITAVSVFKKLRYIEIYQWDGSDNPPIGLFQFSGEPESFMTFTTFKGAMIIRSRFNEPVKLHMMGWNTKEEYDFYADKLIRILGITEDQVKAYDQTNRNPAARPSR
jgi:hypothetical protein